MVSLKNFFLYSFDFAGVCNRKEFWLPFILSILCMAVTWVLSVYGLVFQIIAILVFLILIVPLVSLVVRRLHDTDRGAVYLLWLLFPIVGQLVLLVFMFEKTKYFPK